MAENLLSNLSLKGLKTWQKVAIIGGGLGVAGLAYYETRKKASEDSAAQADTTSANASSGTPATVTDPTTGQSYSSTAIDPATGLTYEEEIDDYGSVEGAEFAYGDNSGTGLESEYSPTDETIPYDGDGTTTPTPSTGYADNADWVTAVESGLGEIGYTQADVANALDAWFAGQSLTSQEAEIVNDAKAEYGNPPSGSYPVTLAPSTVNTTISVPNVVGRTDLDTAEGIITSAGLKAAATGDSPTGNKGSVTSQSPTAGTSVSKGSTVTLTYTVPDTTTTTTAQVTIPNEVGQEADVAQPRLSALGLTSTLSGPAFKAGTGAVRVITAMSPKAGTKVNKGTKVTLTYKISN
jgi:PASTA domain